ncbi:NLR family CARD domain-containing protein 3-like, partial [Sardina pilchardus]|uniref:NLR family CARD domain-containing protein 3-like n=1 Tax=Sardina pilchardus TaxID=27697 RepID=UPI002E1140FA
MKEAYGGDGSVKMTLTILRKMNLNNLADKLEERDAAESGEKDDVIVQKIKEKHKKWMMKKFDRIYECIEDGKNKSLLNETYVELYITEGENEGVNTQHEVRRIETQSKCPRPNKDKINSNDIFECSSESEKIRTVMTTGIAGIGKSICVQKFILDWADGTAHQDIDFIFALPFRQLNFKQKPGDSYSLRKLLIELHHLNEKDINIRMLEKLKIIIIFDGLDERKIPLTVEESEDRFDPLKSASVDVLITHLIKGNLLSNALIWITSRPAAVKQIPRKYIDRWTEVQGFNDQQKDEYFKKKIEDPEKADIAIAHIKRSKSLYIMCHIPVFCWILVNVFLNMIRQTSTIHLPNTLTEVYISFLLTETIRKGQRYGKGFERDDKKCLEFNRAAILKLSELAYEELEKGNIIFYEESLTACGITENDITLYSGMCSEFFKTENSGSRKVYCFMHLSIQEFLAALFVFHSFLNKNIQTLRHFTPQISAFRAIPKKLSRLFKRGPSHLSMTDLLRSAIDKSMQREDGHLDLFLRFLLGISLESNQERLQGLLTHTESSSDSLKETAKYIRKILSEDTKVPERCMNLLLCLLEMKDNSLQQEIQQYIDSGEELSPTQCSRLAYILLVSEETLDEFDLTKYKTTSQGLKRLLVVLRVCRKARLVGCDLQEDSCEAIASVLQSENSQLKELDLSSSPLRDSEVRLLSVGLEHTNCKLETMRFADCKLTDKSCEIVTSVLQSPNSLLQLDLSHNDLGDSGVQLLSKGLSSFNCKIHTLRTDHALEHALDRARPRLLRYACDLTLDPNTAHRELSLSEGNRKVTHMREEQPYPEHPERFDYGTTWLVSPQVLCREGLNGRCYWEAEWSYEGAEYKYNNGGRAISVAYKSIKRKGGGGDVIMGRNAKSWSLDCSHNRYSVCHNNKRTDIDAPSKRVGVYLDWPAGTLSFYRVFADTLAHLHTFHSTFTEPLYPGFWVGNNSSVSLCQ